MVSVTKPMDSDSLLQKLWLIRPRFVYLRVQVREFPIPIFLVAPLIVLEVLPLIGHWAIRNFARESQKEPEMQYLQQALKALSGMTWELRKSAALTLVEVQAKHRVYLKIGLW